MQIKELIKQRRSVRTFNGEPLRAEDLKKIEAYIARTDNPFGVAVEFRILDTKEQGLSSVVIAGTDTYVAAKVKREKYYEMACGYAFEAFCLYAWSLGIGTVMLAGNPTGAEPKQVYIAFFSLILR